MSLSLMLRSLIDLALNPLLFRFPLFSTITRSKVPVKNVEGLIVLFPRKQRHYTEMLIRFYHFSGYYYEILLLSKRHALSLR